MLQSMLVDRDSQASQDGPIRSFHDGEGELTWSGIFDLAEFFRRDRSEVTSLGWQLVRQLEQELPDRQSWITYRVFDGRLTVQSRRREDVAKNLERVVVLANLESLGVSLGVTL
jgi:hypothetical protein